MDPAAIAQQFAEMQRVMNETATTHAAQLQLAHDRQTHLESMLQQQSQQIQIQAATIAASAAQQVPQMRIAPAVAYEGSPSNIEP